MDKELEEYLKHLEEVKKYADKVTTIPVIEERDSNYIYLMHHTSLQEEDIEDINPHGIAYEAGDISRTFNNLSANWLGKSLAKERADLTSMEKVIVDQCKKSSFQCFLYKIPKVFFEPVDNEFYPIPLWNVDKDYIYKKNISSSGVKYDINSEERTFFRLDPKLLLGHYDLKDNTFYRNPDYSPVIANPRGVFDSYQLLKLSSKKGYADFWRHNEFILNDEISPYEEDLQEISDAFATRSEKSKIV